MGTQLIPTKKGAQPPLFWNCFGIVLRCFVSVVRAALGHIMCQSMVNIHFPTTEIRRGKKEEEEERRRRNRMKI